MSGSSPKEVMSFKCGVKLGSYEKSERTLVRQKGLSEVVQAPKPVCSWS